MPPAFPDPGIDYRKRPDLYRIGRGEVGVLTVEPYKSDLLPLWRFKTPAIARKSANALYKRFVAYGRAGDFVGMDMARKFIQMGYTRARRYARHRSGLKYDARGVELPEELDEEKQKAAEMFAAVLEKVRGHRRYAELKRQHQERRKRHGK